MLAAYRKEGAAALAHGNRGCTPAHALEEETRQRVVALARTTYAGFNDTHFSEVLAEEEGLVLSRSTVRRLRLEAGLPRPRGRRPPAHRTRRERRAQAGMLLQLDASPHAWLEDRGPRLSLIAAIDDATGTVPTAIFREQEDAAGYLTVLYQTVTSVGVPEAVYHDRHPIFVPPRRERETLAEQLAGAREPTQVGRALRALGIVSIAAHSPQAKGRVERLFGTLQDRLVAELRLAGATSQEEANALLAAFLPRFNARFAVPAAVPEAAWRPLPVATDPWQICALRYVRVVARDDTVRFGEHWLHLVPPRGDGTYARCRVEVREHLDGSLSVWHHGQQLATQPAPLAAPQLRARAGRGATHPPRGRSSLAQRLQEEGVTFSRNTYGDRITEQQHRV
jgi:hypothetical protein